MRRRILATAALAVLLVLPAVPASAAEATLVSPDGDVTGPTPVELRLDQEFAAERFSSVHVSLRADGERLGERLRMDCAAGCEDFAETARYVLPDGASLEPGTGAPFDAEGPIANGAYVLRFELDRGRFQSPQTFERELHLAVPPTAPKGLAAELDGDDVELTWRASPEPDLETYRVERHDGDDWEKIAATTSTSAVDEPGEGEHRYRVVAVRPDGRGGTVETPSEEVAVEIEAEEDETDEPDRSEDRDDADEADDADETNGRDEADVADESQESQESSSSNGGRDQSRSGTARAPDTGNGGSGSVPSLGERGEDEDGYSEELDYSQLEMDRPDDVQVATPGGWRGGVDRIFDAERVAVPIAMGLVMTTAGLHLWRWLRAPV